MERESIWYSYQIELQNLYWYDLQRGHTFVLVLQWNSDFSNPQFLKSHNFLNKFLSPLDILMCNFTPNFLNLLVSQVNFVSLGGSRKQHSTVF